MAADRPAGPTWVSFADVPAADDDFLTVRPTVIAPSLSYLSTMDAEHPSED